MEQIAGIEMSELSIEFIRAFTMGGTCSAVCTLCGKQHFTTEESDFEDGEYERLLAKLDEEPDKYMQHDVTSLCLITIGGEQIIADCDCGKAKRYEDFVWDNRMQIIDYLKVKIKGNLNEVNRESEAITELQSD